MQRCEVLVDGTWLPGTLLGWTRRDAAGTWWGLVRYAVDDPRGRLTYEHARPQHEIRQVQD